MKKFFTSVAVCAAAAIALTGCGDDKAKEPAKTASVDTTITVGATPVPHADILNFIAPEMKKQAGRDAQGVGILRLRQAQYGSG